MKKLVLIIAIGILSFGCQSEERVIDNSKVSMKLYIADSLNNDVSTYDFPSMELRKENILENLEVDISSPIYNIRENQRKIYLFASDEDKMIVIDALTDTLIAITEFPAESKPFDINFANPADGFVIFKNSNSTANYDLVFDKVAKYINSNSNFSSVTDAGSYTYLCAKDLKEVNILDNRTYQFDSNIELDGMPVLSSITSTSEVLVISVGDTVYDSEEVPSIEPTRFYLISTENKNVRHSSELGDFVVNSKEVVPTDMTTTPLGFAFITSNKGLLRLDTQKNGEFFDVSKRIFSRIEYNLQLKNLILLENNNGAISLAQANSKNGTVVNSYDLSPFANCFHLSN